MRNMQAEHEVTPCITSNLLTYPSNFPFPFENISILSSSILFNISRSGMDKWSCLLISSYTLIGLYLAAKFVDSIAVSSVSVELKAFVFCTKNLFFLILLKCTNCLVVPVLSFDYMRLNLAPKKCLGTIEEI